MREQWHARDLILGEATAASSRAGYALVRLGRLEAAAEVLEQGQARDLAEGLRLHTDEPEKIKDAARRRRYEEAKEQMILILKSTNAPHDILLSHKQKPADEATLRRQNLEAAKAYRQARDNFKAVVQEIRAIEGVNVLWEDTIKSSTILDAARRIGSHHALAYLVATPWGGFALTVLSRGKSRESITDFYLVDLPHLTTHLIAKLLDTRSCGGINPPVEGYAYAQQYQGISLLAPWLRQDKSFREAMALLHKQCTDCKQESMLDRAVQEVLSIPEFAHLGDITPHIIVEKEKTREIAGLVSALQHAFLHHELQRCFEVLGTSVLAPLITALQKHSATSLTLIPCGWLAAFPFAAAPLDSGFTAGSTIPISIAPSARSLQQEATDSVERAGVYTLGNPQMDLEYGEAEAYTLCRIARLSDLQGEVHVQKEATRRNLVKALRNGLVVDISCHGAFDSEDFRRSSLLLASGNRLYLGELLAMK